MDSMHCLFNKCQTQEKKKKAEKNPYSIERSE